jgi:hypothetical protein
MAYGIQVYSANGALQIDSSDSSHILYQQYASGTTGTPVSAGYTGGTLNYGITSATVSGFTRGEDLVFIQPTGTTADVRAFVYITSTGFSVRTSHLVSYRYHVFKKVTSLPDPTSDYSFVVQDASGNTVFNPDVLSARIKGRITGTGSVSLSGKSLYGLANLKYSRITASMAPRRGRIWGWVLKWNGARDQVSYEQSAVSGQGYAASSEFELAAATYFDSTLPTVLIIEAPDP